MNEIKKCCEKTPKITIAITNKDVQMVRMPKWFLPGELEVLIPVELAPGDARFDEGIVTEHEKEISIRIECNNEECGACLVRREYFENDNDMHKVLNQCLKTAVEHWNEDEDLSDGE